MLVQIMIATYDLDFCHIQIYNDYLVVTMNEGITVVPEHQNIMPELVEQHFKNKPFVYIPNRIHSYSVNPTTHLKSSKIENLIGIAVVSDNTLQKNQTKIEKAFFSKAFEYFTTMEEALQWKDSMIKNHSH